MPFELRPYPQPTLQPEGDYLKQAWQQSVYPIAQQMGVEIKLPQVSPQPHTHLAFEGFQYAKEHGKANEYNHRVLKAFFVEGQDIGQLDVLANLAGEVGLDRQEFEQALRTRKYQHLHQRALRHAYEEAGVTGVPMFVIGSHVLSGLQDRQSLEAVIEAELKERGGERGRMRTDQRCETWKGLLHTWDVNPAAADDTFEEIVQAYSGPGRFYHTLDHIIEVLATVDGLASHAKNPNAVKLAAWLHDVIYDSQASDNEERSAEYAERLCRELAIPAGHLVAALIRKTKTHDAGNDSDAQVLIDADLAILGVNEPLYRDYAEKIRREYAWVPESEYRQGRRRVLESFLSRPKIYHFLSHLEEPARRNLADEVGRLSSCS